MRTVRMSWSTKRWIRRHNRRHGTVLILKHIRTTPFSAVDQDGVLELLAVATARCECGANRPAYVERFFGFDGARAAA